MSAHNRDRRNGSPGLQMAMAAQQNQPNQTPQMVIASPFNDLQLVCMVAAKQEGEPAERVRLAMEIVGEAVVAMQGAGLGPAVKAAQNRRAIAGETPSGGPIIAG